MTGKAGREGDREDGGLVSSGPRPLVSVISVLYNSADYLEACISSLGEVSYRPLELVLVDNGSTDGSPLKARECARAAGLDCVISLLKGNPGFAAANNHGFAISRGEVLLLLNPDTEVFPDAVDALVTALQSPGAGLAGCKIYYPDRKTLQHAGGFVRDNGLTMHYGFNEPEEGQYDTIADVPYVTGAALAIGRGIFARAGMLDTGYRPAYFEETDLCLRVRRLGYRVIYAPGARVVHHESVTTGRFTSSYYYLYHKNRVRYMLKNYSLGFLRNRTLPFEARWLDILPPEEKGWPLEKAYLANVISLPLTMISRLRMERRLGRPRIEDTVSEL